MSNSPGLYAHAPFCPGKCPYCDFYSVAALSLAPAWAESLIREAGMRRDQGEFEASEFDTYYFGGGTPSCLPEPVLTGSIRGVLEIFPPRAGSEITVEINPEDARAEKIGTMIEAGANRLSLGIQSLDDGMLKVLGRRHDADQARRAVAAIREAGCGNLGLDLMYGLPGQTVEAWLKTLDEAVTLAPEHLSCYQLTVEPGSRFADLARKGGISLPDEDLSAEFFLATSAYLTGRGYEHYEVSNFARPGFRSRHNGKYWDRTPYLGLGPAAHSFSRGKRWWNVRSVKGYIRSLAEGRLPVDETEALTGEQTVLETIFLGLRTRSGVDVSDFHFRPDGADMIHGWRERGWALMAGTRLTLTTSGWAVADRLTVDLAARVVPEPKNAAPIRAGGPRWSESPRGATAESNP